MTSVKMKSIAALSPRSIGVYQRDSPGKLPSRVQILRSAYSSTRADGKTFGRTTNTYLLSVASETPFLGLDDESKLRALALTEVEIGQVNAKLADLVEPARAHAASYRLAEVSQCAQRLMTFVADYPECRAMALNVLRAGFGVSLVAGPVQEAEPHAHDAMCRPELPNPLLAASIVLDRACTALVEEAKEHREAGLRLTSQRSIETSVSPTANALDRLQASANRIRREQLPAFELACKAAGLMVSKGGG